MKILKSNRYKELLESERLLKSVQSTSGSYQDLTNKRKVLIDAIQRVDYALRQIKATYSSLKKTNGQSLKDYQLRTKKRA